MKVLLYDPYFRGKYGNARYVADLFKHEKLIGCKFYTCSPEKPSYLEDIEEKERFIPLAHNEDSALNKFGGLISKSGLSEKLSAIKEIITYSLRFKQMCEKESIDIVHCNSIRAIITIGLGARLAGCKIVLYIKSNLIGYVFCFFAFFLAHRILFQTKTNQRKTPATLLYLYSSKFRILKNAIDISRIESILSNDYQFSPTNEDDSNISKMIYVGSLVERKGLEFLIHALERIKKDKIDFKLNIVGDPNIDKGYTQKLKDLISEKDLINNIVFVGHVDEPLSVLQEMDFLILPSLDEGVPKSVLESICLGIPVIATNVGGTSEVLDNFKNGLIVEPGDVESLHAAIRKFSQEKTKWKRSAAIQSELSRNEYSFHSHSSSLSLIYREMS
tara:strand:+ start:23973 stop:25136 length:1164 start_codon:yes stop_codon:yes gene_type:complete